MKKEYDDTVIKNKNIEKTEIKEIDTKKNLDEKQDRPGRIEKYSAGKWARREGLDSSLFLWWDNQGLVLTKEQFKKIKKEIYGE